MNPISSKNEASEATAELEKCEIADLTVFNNINWENKGEQIKDKIDAMHLRSEKVLFVDDDIRNLDEAKILLPGL